MSVYLIWRVVDRSCRRSWSRGRRRNRRPANRTRERAEAAVRPTDIATAADGGVADRRRPSLSDRSCSTPARGGCSSSRAAATDSLPSGSSTRWRGLFRFRCSWSGSRRRTPTATS